MLKKYTCGCNCNPEHGHSTSCMEDNWSDETFIDYGEYEGFIEKFNETAKEVNDIAVSKGWWKGDRNEGEIIALMHSELSEGLEALRHGNPPSEHIPEFSGIEEELADVIIRIMDMQIAKGWRVGEAIVSKIAFNRNRPYKHGGKKF